MGQFSKPWEELTFADNYMFCKVMRKEELCKEFLKTLLKLDVDHIEYMNTEHHIENFYDAKGVRMDLFLKDSNRIIDLEMQTGNYEDLVLRARYYQSAADVSTVPRRMKYKDLKESYIVFICKDDPFGQGLPVYTRVSKFLETEKIPYNDKIHHVFYNSSAWKKVEDKEVQNVLRFVYELKAESGFTKKLEQEVIESRYSALQKDNYMYFSDVLEEEKEEARAIGLAEGRATGLAEGRAEGRAEGEKNKAIEAARLMINTFHIPEEEVLEKMNLTKEDLK